MSLLAVPALMFSYNGSRIATEKKDSFGLYKFTIGNIGYDPSSLTYHIDSSCNSTLSIFEDSEYTGPCIHLYNQAFTIPEVVGILSLFQILQILSFFCFIFHLQRVTNTIKVTRERLSCSISHYTIIVKNMPPDTTKEEIAMHFNKLYPLDVKDWRNRPPVGTPLAPIRPLVTPLSFLPPLL